MMCLWLPFLTQNQLFDGRYVVFSAGISQPATPLLPISRPCFPQLFQEVLQSTPLPIFLWELTHQFCRPIVIQQIQIFMITLSSSLNTILMVLTVSFTICSGRPCGPVPIACRAALHQMRTDPSMPKEPWALLACGCSQSLCDPIIALIHYYWH